jgi:hypothetical protein
MSTEDEQAKAVSEDEISEIPETEYPEKGENEQDGSGAMIILFFILGFVASLIVGWVIFPKLLYSQKQQPVAFNHALHNELVDEGCESCHFFREDGSYSGVPKLAQCIDCHEEVQGESEAEEYFVTEYVQKEREVPWLIYAKQPPCVFFSHVAHVKKGGMDCVTCHGHIGESESLRVYEENRISGYSRDIWGKNIGGFKKNSWDRMKMDDCAECHRKENVNQGSVQTEKGGCFVCHR